MILILLGPPGAGKGTQAKLLGREYDIPHISTGDMFRDHKARATEIGKKIQAIMDAGGLVTDEITNDIVKERLSRPDVAGGFILDGYPRTTAQ
ncbi:MAG TPA: nucleoside monophosphate kinase, partial [Anaeromyxobacteraceae bacterium]|nr:nucleoside monophosphate kinase [Anaeromyxobacteraceae bacterium]